MADAKKMENKFDVVDSELDEEIAPLSDEENSSDDNAELNKINYGIVTKKKGENKKGRKCVWKESFVDDLVDVILDNQKYKEKRLLANTRNKFKRCVGLRREAALKVKTASGIKRFQEDKEFGRWFSKLYPVITSMVNCQPQQAIEPGDIFEDSDASLPGTDNANDQLSTPLAVTSLQGKKRKVLFVPEHDSARKSKKLTTEKFMNETSQSIKELGNVLAEDPTKDLLDFLKEDAERQARSDDMFMSLMRNLVNGGPAQAQYIQPRPIHSQPVQSQPQCYNANACHGDISRVLQDSTNTRSNQNFSFTNFLSN
eukprot:gene21050-23105_t